MPSILQEQVSSAANQGKNVQPWVADEQLRIRLEDAGWRYAVLIGVVDPAEVDIAERTRNDDQKRYGHFVENWGGWPLWDNKDATTFVAEVAGASREVSAAWLDFDWNNGGEV